jgi:tRNA(Ile)-lysidine synthase
VVLVRPGFDLLPEETRLRLLSDAIRWVGGAVYRPRLAALEAAVAAGGRRTLQGTVLTPTTAAWRVGREWAAVREMRAPLGELWDGRWQVEGPEVSGLEVRALGEAGLAACPAWRVTGLARATLVTTPAVWRGEELVAAPLAGLGEGWRARIVADFGR